MSEKIQKIEARKILHEYNFLLLDDEYKKEVISENTAEFLERVQKLKIELGIFDEPEIPGEEKEGEEKKEKMPKKPKLDPDSISKNTKSKIKKLYREIAKKTHPDKVTSEDLIELYMKATSAADNYNLFELFIICIELNIEIEVDEDDKEILLKIIEMKKEELRNIEASFIWLYANSKTEEEKNNLIDLFVKKHGKKN
jgi:hypothetical protein